MNGQTVRQSKGVDWNQYVDEVSFAQTFRNRLVSGEPGVDTYVWVKPPGESDGSSSLIRNDEGNGFDRMCDPTYTGNARNGNSLSGALPNAPISGAWFSAQFQELMRNGYPPLS